MQTGQNTVAQGTKDAAADEEKQTSGKQLVAVIFILSLATKMFLLPVFLIQSAGRDGYIILAAYGIFELLTLIPMLIAIRLSDDDIFVLVSRVVGKIGAKIVAAVLGLFLFFKLNTAIAEIMAFYGTNVFADFDTSLMLIVLLVFMSAAGSHTLRALCRLNEILVPIILLCLFVLAAIVVMTGLDLENVLPAVRSPREFTDALVRHPAWVGDFTPLVILVGRTKTKKHTWRFAAGAGIVGTAISVFFAIVLSAAFGNVPMLIDSTSNLSNILQFSVGNVYGRLDMFSFILWSVSVFIEAALFFYATCRCVSFVIGRKAGLAQVAAVSFATYILQVFVLVDPMNFSVAITSPACAVITPILSMTVPLFALLCAVVNRHRASEHTAGRLYNDRA